MRDRFWTVLGPNWLFASAWVWVFQTTFDASAWVRLSKTGHYPVDNVI
jgi:hypothetical protein